MEIKNGVASIGGSAFRGCSRLTLIEIPNSVTSIGNEAFNGCSSLKSIIVNMDKPIAISSNVFSSVDKTKATFYVPKGTAEDYKKADVWLFCFAMRAETIFRCQISAFIFSSFYFFSLGRRNKKLYSPKIIICCS